MNLDESKKQLVITIDKSLVDNLLPRTFTLTGVMINGVEVEIKNVPISNYKKIN